MQAASSLTNGHAMRALYFLVERRAAAKGSMPMPSLTKKERVRAALAGQPVDRTPVALWGHDFLREWDPQDLADATIEDYHANDWDFIKLNPRWTYFAEAWGSTYEPPTQQRHPRPLESAVSNASDLHRIEPKDPKSGVFAEHLEALQLTIKAAGPDVDVLHTIFSPLSILGLMCGAPHLLIEFANEQPESTRSALDAITETITAYAAESLSTGATGIFYAPLLWASRDACTEDFYRDFGRPGDLNVLAAIEGAPFNILHVCGNNNMLDDLLDYPVAAFNWADHGEGNLSLAEARPRTDKAVMGGIDHARLHAMSVDDIAAQGREAVDACPDHFLLAGGCGIRPDTSLENRKAVASAAS